jgi:hypothetical protein
LRAFLKVMGRDEVGRIAAQVDDMMLLEGSGDVGKTPRSRRGGERRKGIGHERDAADEVGSQPGDILSERRPIAAAEERVAARGVPPGRSGDSQQQMALAPRQPTRLPEFGEGVGIRRAAITERRRSALRTDCRLTI